MLLAFFFQLAGLGALSLSLDRHARDFFQRPPASRQRLGLRLAGWILLALSLPMTSTAWHDGIGLVTWFGLLTTAGLSWMAVLTYAPRRP